MPPAHAKSMLYSIRLPTYLLACNPALRIVCISNTFTLTETQAKVRRRILTDPRWLALAETELQAISDQHVAALDINTTHGGFIKSFSAGSTILGQRADIIISDDIVGSIEEALNPSRLLAMRQWYFGEVRSRFELTALPVEVLVGTRWAQGDLFGHVEESVALGFEDWKIVKLPLICEQTSNDPLERTYGQYLWPDLPDIERRAAEWKRTLGPAFFSAMYQQQPIDATGSWASADMVEIVDRPPKDLRILGATDLALGSESSARGDYSVHAVVGTSSDGCVYVLDLWRYNTTPMLDTIDAMLDLVKSYGYQVQLFDDDNIIKALKQTVTQRMAERGIFAQMALIPMRGRDKVARAGALQMLLHARKVKLVRAPWNAEVIGEITTFGPGSTGHDDIIDALGLIAREVMRIGKPASPSKPTQEELERKRTGGYAFSEFLIDPMTGQGNAQLQPLFEDRERTLLSRNRIP
jgi:predicted phage terminase large subunit-like protein